MTPEVSLSNAVSQIAGIIIYYYCTILRVPAVANEMDERSESGETPYEYTLGVPKAEPDYPFLVTLGFKCQGSRNKTLNEIRAPRP